MLSGTSLSEVGGGKGSTQVARRAQMASSEGSFGPGESALGAGDHHQWQEVARL
ncbi:hypothetical protein PanWU01x14_088660 [Parasponia andersonii]|uniref:Uncharacterized protein n=1 Tax=Parasponia andersonii TaxID=3476 RepID=A0A2P5D829_PARAD|nr:hypothetical protein PanWU01x14_088660 [Parasponia andersonii]